MFDFLQPIDCGLPGSSVHGILQAKILEWVAMLSSRGSSNPGIEPRSPAFPALQAYTHTHTHTHTHYMYIDISIYTHTYIHTHTHIIHKWPTCYNFTHELDYLAGDPKRPAGYSYIEAISISYSTILHLFFLSLTDCWATDQINSSVIWLIAWWIKA